jgi:pyruvate dehydrogenase (quinone)
VPPLPPHITFKQAKNFLAALAKSEPERASALRGAACQVLETVLQSCE